MRYYRVMCKHGHHGSRNYQPIIFAFGAVDAAKAMELAKKMPGVKHSSHVIECREISYSEYLECRKTSAYHKFI